MEQLLVVSNVVYLLPFIACVRKGFYVCALINAATGIVSAWHHLDHTNQRVHRLDIAVAFMFFLANAYNWLTLYQDVQSLAFCVLSLLLFLYDCKHDNDLAHLGWHLTTGIGIYLMYRCN